MGETVVKLTPAQKFIAKKMKQVNTECPQAVTAFDVDMTNLLALKKKQDEAGNKITITAYMIKAFALALQKSPIMNSRFIDNQIHMFDEFNVGVAMAVPRGLIVPVIKNVENKSCSTISQELKGLKEKFANNNLTADDMAGGTCTISSLGNGKNDLVLPMINEDQCVMLGVGSTKKKPVVMEDGSIVARDIVNISCTSNHCIVYGAEVGKFCADIAEIIENADKYLGE